MDGKLSQADPQSYLCMEHGAAGRNRTAGNCSPAVPWVRYWLHIASYICDLGAYRGLK